MPIRFNGRLLAEGTTNQSNEDTRAYAVRIYRTTTGRYVGQVVYETSWNTEVCASTVYVEDAPTALALTLLDHDCLKYFVGYPDGGQFETKQERLEFMLRSKYQSLVSKLLVELGTAVEPN